MPPNLYRLLTSYADAGNADRLYNAELDLLEAAEFDMQLAGAELLGRDVAAICDARILHQVLSVLAEEGNCERLVIDMVRTSTYAEATPFVEKTLSAFGRGFGTGLAQSRRWKGEIDGKQTSNSFVFKLWMARLDGPPVRMKIAR